MATKNEENCYFANDVPGPHLYIQSDYCCQTSLLFSCISFFSYFVINPKIQGHFITRPVGNILVVILLFMLTLIIKLLKILLL